ncbi:hypothetical protein SVA_3872 [Sulfurifustis variabilis]|uniref:DUF2782 domain-containing protein n=1 Tax=Sulfurifustis variabilis TaxID=1675686 RepID=A0A1C7AG23_9GAMM|nr:hypothetical protein SVA_3872 [Sulfurifustis variabilis]
MLLLGGLAAAPPLPGAERPAPPPAAVPEPPPPPEQYDPPDLPGAEVDELEPEVTITTRGTEIHEEYRLNGQLYMVKVTPAKGRPYYLIYDEVGRARRSDLEPDIMVPNWVIKRF